MPLDVAFGMTHAQMLSNLSGNILYGVLKGFEGKETKKEPLSEEQIAKSIKRFKAQVKARKEK
jgi:hypothetical protein